MAPFPYYVTERVRSAREIETMLSNVRIASCSIGKYYQIV